ncbi:hypothetical protein BZG01_15885 [Labilibaculum manganireducens]|uniref:5-bromo-4-chloroindolyl phosphate hydrolysis protein n=1 Tax=Labilibaculum manganireducens TaxID=1940525 RepID=A0A2N3HZ16_9BACT|nr:hypothetical protein [Labilibaculum manganireducens]PKQ63305.1 hypothetical protein BZG01_15885 [Labilibaculum manganireducens]
MNKQTLFNILLFGIAVIALIFSILRVIPFSVNGETFIGIIAAFIGIIVTLHIGFQIIKYLEIREELKESKKTMAEILVSQKRITIVENKSQEIYYTLLAKSITDDMQCVERFLTQLEALTYALKADRKNFDDIFYTLRTYITKINYGPIYGGTNNRDKELSERIGDAQKIDLQIKAFSNYCSVKYEYEHIMKFFYRRLEKARNNESVSLEESNEIMNG